MKLRTQFMVLVGGIIAVPFLVSTFMLFEQFYVARGREPLPNYPQIMSWINRKVPRAIRRHDFQALEEGRPPGLDIVIMDKDDVITTSTIPELPSGMSANNVVLMQYIRTHADKFHFQLEASHAPGNDDSLLILKLPKIRPEEARFRKLALELVTYPTIALLVFSSLMSFLILRSLNRSILTLEGATRRIADGNLDFELPARGNDRIASLTRSFDSMRRALKEEYARRARFIMGVSHDLRTPLTLIQGYVEAIADGYAAEPDTQKRYLSLILDKSRTLEGMIADLIGFVRMETGEWRLTHREVAVRQFLTDIARRFAEDALILKREFSWSIDCADTLMVRMDAGLFTRALENLVGNAIRYTSQEGKIALTARTEGAEIALSIADTGIGIPPDDLSHIFDPFYRGTNSRRESGFGLGLTTVKSIIEGHGWSIGVSSEVGKGTTFTIRMPVSAAAV
ncbi:MAG TPA: HAMP domain-containing sensor histidine kinase [Spirochaetia bacterium]|nr:HAMP domain-containing sensor histidine kinase [Spirochaetia bacterium]